MARSTIVAAYNHGYCYAMTFATRKLIDANKLMEEAEYFYAAKSKQEAFRSGYFIGLNDINSGTLKPVCLA